MLTFIIINTSTIIQNINSYEAICLHYHNFEVFFLNLLEYVGVFFLSQLVISRLDLNCVVLIVLV